MQIIKKILGNKTLKLFIEYFNRADISNASAVIAYYALLALFPAVIAIGSMLPYIGIKLSSALAYLKTAVPVNIYTVLAPIIKSILGHQGVGLFSVGLIVTLWSLSKLVALFRQRLDIIYDVKSNRPAILGRFVSMIWIIAVIALMGTLIFLTTISKTVLTHLEALKGAERWVHLVEGAKWPVVIVILVLGVLLLNYALPAKRPRFKWALIGSMIEVVGFLALTQVFGFYVSIAASRYSFYQAIGSIIILLIWLNLVAEIALVGATIIAILNHNDTMARLEKERKAEIVNDNWGKTHFLKRDERHEVNKKPQHRE
ncbi:YihY/virulence factor BrkB family protein [Periweissella cryptocerci]|uniref:YihY/virulence factor BrkB family protein n=1 Tax=Periweissella cryptocerci TaxID=2506420 RepID=UPI0014045900|nr:YihY/virulence factor BrkB family protein [Periweissella cryptocerci]